MVSFQTTGCHSPEQALAACALEIMPPPVNPLEVRGIKTNIVTKIVTNRTIVCPLRTSQTVGVDGYNAQPLLLSGLI